MHYHICYRNLWIFVAVSFLVLGTACNSTGTAGENGSSSTEPMVIAPVTSDPDPLTGTSWELVDFEDQNSLVDIPVEPTPFIKFEKGTLNLITGCNDPGGHYLLEDNQITISFTRVTTMDCTDTLGSDVMTMESAFSSALSSFETYAIDADKLYIFYADGELLFHRIN
jgi:heat shock protein HslJ